MHVAESECAQEHVTRDVKSLQQDQSARRGKAQSAAVGWGALCHETHLGAISLAELQCEAHKCPVPGSEQGQPRGGKSHSNWQRARISPAAANTPLAVTCWFCHRHHSSCSTGASLNLLQKAASPGSRAGSPRVEKRPPGGCLPWRPCCALALFLVTPADSGVRSSPQTQCVAP